jgi:aspartyl-tRNA(Asn)/glutamyl-tRNA(Gln) amidotransferase subunit B
MSGIDLNRAGTPLLEIVSEPDMRSAEEAVAYARALHALVRWIGICDGNMQEGSFRCDGNVSVRRPGGPLGTRREIKNLNSFRFLQQAIEYEVKWQIETLEDGGSIEQATVLFDPERGETRMMRTKEDAHDYRYFPDPDLLPLVLGEADIEKARQALPELPQARRARYVESFGLTPYDAAQLTASREMADYFDAVAARLPAEAKLVANWVMGELAGRLNREDRDIAASPLPPDALAGLLARIADGTISGKIAKDVFDAMWAGEGGADEIIDRKGLKQISDSGAIEKIVDEVIAANAQQVADYRGGKEKAFNSLVGQVMKASRGKANPAQVNEILRKKLG